MGQLNNAVVNAVVNSIVNAAVNSVDNAVDVPVVGKCCANGKTPGSQLPT